MNVHMIGKDGQSVGTTKAKNKAEMREIVLASKNLHLIAYVDYGVKRYTMTDIYRNLHGMEG